MRADFITSAVPRRFPIDNTWRGPIFSIGADDAAAGASAFAGSAIGSPGGGNAGGAAGVGTLFFCLISYISIRTKMAGRGLLDFMTWLPWAVPGILLAVGLLWAVAWVTLIALAVVGFVRTARQPGRVRQAAYRALAGAVAAQLSILNVERGSYLETFSLEWKQ